jgi:ABC-type phosphate/phosphonate transport system substrate-binding protein
MIASLMMYKRPELEPAQEAYWQAIREGLAQRGIPAPETLSDAAPPMEVWTDPELVLSQTCGMPYRRFLSDRVALVGTPDFGVADCPPGYYRSALVVRRSDERGGLSDYRDARFAYNETGSQSGYAAPYAAASACGFWFNDRAQTHGHRDSARAVAEGRADIAALDAVSWRFMERFDAFVKDLRVLEWTAPTPGLPYITALTDQVDQIAHAVRGAIAALPDEHRQTLGLKGLVRIPAETYLAVPNPPASAG